MDKILSAADYTAADFESDLAAAHATWRDAADSGDFDAALAAMADADAAYAAFDAGCAARIKMNPCAATAAAAAK